MKKIILLADDGAGIQEMPVRVLESEQYEVVLAATRREAATKFAAKPPDLVLLTNFKTRYLKHLMEGRSSGVRE